MGRFFGLGFGLFWPRSTFWFWECFYGMMDGCYAMKWYPSMSLTIYPFSHFTFMFLGNDLEGGRCIGLGMLIWLHTHTIYISSAYAVLFHIFCPSVHGSRLITDTYEAIPYEMLYFSIVIVCNCGIKTPKKWEYLSLKRAFRWPALWISRLWSMRMNILQSAWATKKQRRSSQEKKANIKSL